MRRHLPRGIASGSLALALALGALPAHAAKTPAYAITKAKVVTVSGAIIENATVVFRLSLIHI